MSPEELSAYLEVVKSFAEPAAKVVFESTVKAVFIRNLVGLVGAIISILSLTFLTIGCFSRPAEYERLIKKLLEKDVGDKPSWQYRKYVEEIIEGMETDMWNYLAGVALVLTLLVLIGLVLPGVITNVLVPEAKAIQILIRR
ncbi:MAG: hypothetical protein ACXABD_22575 [Candidatus Thorarchaeota archaeon]|jgi:hypothetical protein